MKERGKSVATEDDEQEMKCRWMKQRMHSELDMTRDVWLSRQEEAPVDLEVEFEMHETEQQSVIVQTEKAASRLLKQLGGDTDASAAKSPPPALPSEGRAYWAADEHADPDYDDPADDLLLDRGWDRSEGGGWDDRPRCRKPMAWGYNRTGEDAMRPPALSFAG